jgi:myo-inositol-1(or 4)-monophosphatase
MQPMVNIALRAARQASEQITHALERLDLIKSEQSSVATFLSDTCKNVERTIAFNIQKANPHHSIFGEYSGEYPAQEEGPNPCEWRVHPIDSVVHFSNGIPSFALCITGTMRGKVEHALILNPVTGEEFTASNGQGAQLNGKRLRVSNSKMLDSTLIGTGFLGRPSDKSNLDLQLNINRALIEANADIFSTGSVALNLAYTAAGRIDGVVQTGVVAEEVDAGLLILREAGGLSADFTGGTDIRGKGELIAANPKLFKALVTKVHSLK